MQKEVRINRELAKMKNSPPDGICCYQTENLSELEADIKGPERSPYETGVFKIKITIPQRYPFEPPILRFITKVYHPNIDCDGRICMDLLKLPPHGNWKPTTGIEGLLIALRMLLGTPNPDDPLMTDIANEYVLTPDVFEKKAKEYTKKYAK